MVEGLTAEEKVVLAAMLDARLVEFVSRPVKPLLPRASALDEVFVQAGVMMVISVVVLKTWTNELVLGIGTG